MIAELKIERWLPLALLICVSMCGCAQSRVGANALGDTNAQLSAQLNEMNQRLGRFDADNRELHAQVARLQQTLQVSEQEKKLLREQLADASEQLENVELARRETSDELNALQASSQRRGGATITANNSLKEKLSVVELPGVETRLDGDVVRIEIPADRIFGVGTTQFQQGAPGMLEELANALRRHYPRQIIGIEGHTDNVTASRSVVTAHQLTATQALAVFHQLTRSGAIPEQQMFTMGLGANRPRFSNAEAAGRARNRRIEVVIYPELYAG